MRRDQLYTAEELEQIKRGEIPEGRKRHAVLQKAKEMGVTIARLCPNKWSAKELRLLRENKVVPGRSLKACYTKAFKLKILYHPKGESFTAKHILRQEKEAEIIEALKENGGMIRATGRAFGLSYATISTIAKEAGLTHNKSPKERKGACISWGGASWCWYERADRNSLGYWRETSGERRNLARVIWEKSKGKIPPRHVIVFRNGDRFDLRLENLEMLTNSVFGNRQQLDPIAKAKQMAGGALGRLNTQIRRATDPEYDKRLTEIHQESARKAQAIRWGKKTAI